MGSALLHFREQVHHVRASVLDPEHGMLLKFASRKILCVEMGVHEQSTPSMHLQSMNEVEVKKMTLLVEMQMKARIETRLRNACYREVIKSCSSSQHEIN